MASGQVRNRLARLRGDPARDRLLADGFDADLETELDLDRLDESHQGLIDRAGGPDGSLGWTPDSRRRHREVEAPPRPSARLSWRALAVLLAPALLFVGWWVSRGQSTTTTVAAPRPVSPATGATPSAPTGSVPGSGSPTPTGTPAAPTQVYVHVVGAVASPGVVTLTSGQRVADAVQAAGGARSDADLVQVNLARGVTDGEQIVVPRPGETPVTAAAAGPSAPAPTSTAGADAQGSGGPPAAGDGELVDVNTASVSELDALPGIGPVLAQRIVDHRTSNGPFHSVDELGEVPGIGDKMLGNLRPKVRVG